jgi:hypothetical protein
MSDLALPEPTEWNNVVSNKHPHNWAVYEVTGKKKKKLELTASGPGGIADAIKHLKDDGIQFFGFRVTGLDKKGGVTSVRSKFIKVCWIGSQVGSMGKASVTVIMGKAMDFFDRCHLGFQVVGDIDELTEERIEKKLRASGGAHQVERYDFTNVEAPGADASPKAASAAASKVRRVAANRLKSPTCSCCCLLLLVLQHRVVAPLEPLVRFVVPCFFAICGGGC